MRYIVLIALALALAACADSGPKAPTATPRAAQQAETAVRPADTALPATRAPAPPVAPSVAPTQQPAAIPPTRAPAPPPVAAGRVYPCESGDCDCADFPSHAEAQRVYNKHGGNNWSRLDRDLDGIACETLP